MLSCTGKKITVPCTGSKDTYGPVHWKEGRCRSRSEGCSLSRAWKGRTLTVQSMITVPCTGRILVVPCMEGLSQYRAWEGRTVMVPCMGRKGAHGPLHGKDAHGLCMGRTVDHGSVHGRMLMFPCIGRKSAHGWDDAHDPIHGRMLMIPCTEGCSWSQA